MLKAVTFAGSVVLALISGLGVPASSASCSATEASAGLCATATEDRVDVFGSLKSQDGSDTGSQHIDEQEGIPPAPAPEDCGPLNRCEQYEVVTVPDLTLADLASFRPATPTLAGEPSGFAVVGMPANLVATASEQHIPGTVLGWHVTVRFVPTAYVFDHGDGTSARAVTGGATWADLGLAQFTPTATSHIYRTRGEHTVSVTVEYAAAVDFGSGLWRPVPGVVRATTGGYGVRVVDVRTALVDRTCTEDSSGPGC